MDGFTKGFHLGHEGPRSTKLGKNHKSADEFPNVIREKLNKELRASRFAGPFQDPPFETYTINPLGLVPKTTDDGRDLPVLYPQDPGSYCLITDLRRSGINSAIPREVATVKYTKFDKIIAQCLHKGKGCFLAKTDVKSAFPIIPINPQDWPLLTMRFDDQYFVDKCLPFGLASSCAIFEEVATALEHIVRTLLTEQYLDHYLDDFISCENDRELTNQAVQILVDTCTQLGVPIAWDKTVWGTTRIRFLGLDVDTVLQQVIVPEHKVLSLRRKIDHVLQSKTVRVKTLQSLAGSMNFYARGKPGGRTFIRRIYDAERALPSHYHVNVTRELRKDLKMWCVLLRDTHHATPFVDIVEIPAQDMGYYTDAAGGAEKGWGAYLDGRWLQGEWGEFHSLIPSIAWCELYAVVVSAVTWAPLFSGKRILLHCDNQSACAMVNKLTTPDTHSMVLVRHLTMAQMKFGFKIKAEYIKSKENTIADAISRFQEFQDLAPGIRKEPDTPPTFLCPPSKDMLKNSSV